MNIVEKTKEEMDSLKALADTNMKIGVAKTKLQELEELETEYLIQREQKAIDRIQKMFDDSKELLDSTMHNYKSIKELLNEATNFAEFLIESKTLFEELIKDFENKNEAWDIQAKEHEKNIAEARQAIEIDRKRIESEQKVLDRNKELLRIETIKIEDGRKTLERALKRLKENKL